MISSVAVVPCLSLTRLAPSPRHPEKISAANIREARSHPSGSSRPSPEIKHRGVIFPGQDDNLGERDVALIEGSFGARKSAAELGKLLHQHLNPQLTDEGLRHLVEFLRTGSRPF